jgi:3',5'-cyclic AMP phosphodiesterase CpdA
MDLNFRFAVVSDLHVALPHTLWDGPNRLHLVEVAIPSLEIIFDRLAALDLDFLLLPGDLTQHGEPENHQWLADRLAQLPYPVYVIPGNHDVPVLEANEQSIGFEAFPGYYRQFGYGGSGDAHYYTQQILPGLRLIALNSNIFDASGQQVGRIDEAQMAWLRQTLAQVNDELVMVMVHHNLIEHMPGQSQDPLGKRYILENAEAVQDLLRGYGVQMVFTGHLHIQNVAESGGLYDITTGSLVSYPHPYRTVECRSQPEGGYCLTIESDRITAVPEWPDLAAFSQNLMADRSEAFMLQILTQSPLSLSEAEAALLVPQLRAFWGTFAAGDSQFSFPEFPPQVRSHFEAFSSAMARDNSATIWLSPPKRANSDRPRCWFFPVAGVG